MEPEGIETPLQESQLKGPGQNTTRSQCRGRGFEPLHLHQDQVVRLLCCERDEIPGPRIARTILL